MKLTEALLILLAVSAGSLVAVSGEENEEMFGEETAMLFKPTFLSKPSRTYLHKYDSITLNCSVDKLGDLVLIWKKDTQMLTIAKQIFNEGISLKIHNPNSYSITIKNVTEKSAGDYNCIVSHPELKYQLHSVQILRPSKVEQIPADGMVKAQKGDNVTLTCNVTGNPMPNVTWIKNGKLHTEGVMGEFGEKLVFPSVTRLHSGDYKCIASNKLTKDAMASFKVIVRFPPEIELENNWIHSGEGVTTEIMCTAHASHPLVRIVWLHKGGNKVKTVQPAIDRQGSTHKLKLQLRKVTRDDFGEYTCVAENDLGTDMKKVHISGLAEKVKFRSDVQGKLENSYKLMWSVKSYSPISQYSLKYRETKYNKSRYNSLTIPSKSSQSSVLHTEMYNMAELKTGTQYDVIMQARNKYGWNKPSDIFTFKTNDLSENKIKENESENIGYEITNEIQVNAQPQEKSQNAASLLQISCWLLLAVLSSTFF